MEYVTRRYKKLGKAGKDLKNTWRIWEGIHMDGSIYRKKRKKKQSIQGSKGREIIMSKEPRQKADIGQQREI